MDTPAFRLEGVTERCTWRLPITIDHERVQFLSGGFAAVPTTHGKIVLHGGRGVHPRAQGHHKGMAPHGPRGGKRLRQDGGKPPTTPRTLLRG